MEQQETHPSESTDGGYKNLLVWVGVSTVVTAGVFVAVLCVQPDAGAPARPGDGPDYDNIGFNLALGRGFGLDFTHPEFLRPYRDYNEQGTFDYLLDRSDTFRPTTLRPPVFPFLLSVIYRTTDRDFYIVRLAQIAMASLAIGLAVGLAAQMGGTLPALLTLILAIVDSLVRSDSTLKGYCFDLLTEPTAQLLLMGSIWCLLLLRQRPNSTRALIAGAVLGLLILSRSVFALWLPFLLIWLLAIGVTARRTASTVRPVRVAVALLVGAGVVVAPWWVRNCILLQDFMPLGTHGWISLLGGNCDEAVESGGNWSMAPVNRCWKEINGQPWFQEIDSAVIQDREFAKACRSQMLAWIRANPRQVTRLFFRRLTTHWFPYPGKIMLLSVSALAGLIIALTVPPRHVAIYLLSYLLLIDALIVMLTYSTGGRFLVPLYPILYVLAAIGIARAVSLARDRWRKNAT